MKKKILFVPTLSEFSRLLHATSNIDNKVSFISESLYYPKLIKEIDKDELLKGVPNVIEIAQNLKYEFEIPDTVSNCKVKVYSWETLSDCDCYDNFEKYSIILIDGCGDTSMKISLFEDGSVVKATYPKINIPVQQQMQGQYVPYSYGPSSYSYRYAGPTAFNVIYDTNNPIYELHPANKDERIVVYEYSDVKY